MERLLGRICGLIDAFWREASRASGTETPDKSVKKSSRPGTSSQRCRGAALEAARSIKAKLESEETIDFPRLRSLSRHLENFKGLISLINSAVDHKGGVKDDASPRLWDIRMKARKIREKIEGILAGITANPRVRKLLENPEKNSPLFPAECYIQENLSHHPAFSLI